MTYCTGVFKQGNEIAFKVSLLAPVHACSTVHSTGNRLFAQSVKSADVSLYDDSLARREQPCCASAFVTFQARTSASQKKRSRRTRNALV